MSFVIKVDRVASFQEAKELEGLGVDIISLDLEADPRFGDNRCISEELFCRIKQVCNFPEYCISMSMTDKNLSIIERHSFDYFQYFQMEEPTDCIRNYLNTSNINVIMSGLNACHDDDIAWVKGSLQDDGNIFAKIFQVDLLADLNGAWKFLKQESPKYPEEMLQIEDINILSSQFPLIIELDFTPSNVVEILNYFPYIQGINFKLGENPLRNDLHCIEFDTLMNILHVLKNIR